MTDPARGFRELELTAAPKDSASQRRQSPLRSTCARPHQCARPMRMRILAQIPLFAGLSEEELDDIDQKVVALSWTEGDRLYTAGEPAEYLYVIAAGHVKAVQSTGNGQEIIVDVRGPGDFFGGYSVVGEPAYAETVEALVTTCALRMDSQYFRELLLKFPQLALRALDDVTALLGGARSIANQQATSTVTQRVATTLLQLADKFGQHGGSGDGTLIQLPLSRADLAAMAGSTPESVSRTMSRLRKDGIVDTGRRWTSILDRDKLAAIIATDL